MEGNDIPQFDTNQEKMRGPRKKLSRRLRFVDFTKVIFSFRRQRKSIFPDVRLVSFTRRSENSKG